MDQLGIREQAIFITSLLQKTILNLSMLLVFINAVSCLMMGRLLVIIHILEISMVPTMT